MKRQGTRLVWKALLPGPAGAVAGMVGGFAIGIFFRPAAEILAPIGQIYMSLLMMCILPILVTAMVSALARLIRTREIRDHLGRLAAFFSAGLLVPGCVGALAALILGPGKSLSRVARSSLGELVLDSDSVGAEGAGLLGFLLDIVPSNIFESLTTGDMVSIVFACTLVGLAFGLVRSCDVEPALQFIDVIADSFKLIFNWVLSIAPIGICCVLAGQLSDLNLGIFQVLAKFIVVFYVTALFLGFIYNLLLSRTVGTTFWGSLKALKGPLVLAYSVDSSLVTLAPCMEALYKRLAVDPRMAGLILPFGLIANRHGKILMFAFTTIFLAQLHGIQLGLADITVVILAACLTGMAAVGSGVVLAASLMVVLCCVPVPTVLAPIILMATGPIVDRMQSALTVLANCTLAAVAANPRTREKSGSRDGGVPPSVVDQNTA